MDRVDEVESTLSTSIDEAKRDLEIPILESEEELENLDVPIGKLAAVIGKGRSFRECYWPTEFPENGDDIFPFLTHIPSINVLEGPITSTIVMALQASNNGDRVKVIQLTVDNSSQMVTAFDGVTNRVYVLSSYGQVNVDVLQDFNDLLASDVYRYIALGSKDNLTEDEFDALDKLIRWDVSSYAYIKGGSWEKLIKERDLKSATGSVVFYTPVLGDLTEEQKMKNREAYQKVVDANGIIDIKLNFLLLLQTPSLISFDSSNNIVLLLVATTGGSKYIVSSDGNVTVESIEIPEANGGVEIRELHISQLKENNTITQENQLTDEQKAYNLETLELVRQDKAITSVSINNERFLLYVYEGDTFKGSALINSSLVLGLFVAASIDDQGNCLMELSIYGKDNELSDTSENVVQNKVVTAALKDKVDKVDGKQLSTEDFTSILKTKLDGLNNYDDTEINNALSKLQTQLNTLVNGDASTAIESFNEIIAFLSGINDSEGLDAIIASIEQQIARAIDAIPTHTSELTNDSGFLTEHQDISHLAKKEELDNLANEMVANEEVHAAAYNDLDSRLKDIGSLISGVAVTKEEFQEGLQAITDEIVANEEVIAAALTDLNNRIQAIITRLNSAGL